MSRSSRFYRWTIVGFFALWIPVLVALIADLRPVPVYQNVRTDGVLHHSVPNFEKGEPLAIQLEAPSDDISGVYWMNLISLPFVKATLTIENLTQQGEPIDLGAPDDERVTRFDGRGFNDAGDRIQLTIQKVAETPPGLWLTEVAPTHSVTAIENDAELMGSPLIYFGRKNPKKRSEPDPTYSAFPDEAMGGGMRHPLTSGVPVTIRTISPVDAPEMILLPRALAGEDQATIEVSVRNITRDTLLKEWRSRAGTDQKKTLNAETTEEGDEIEITLLWHESPPPRIQQPPDPLVLPITVLDGGVPTEVRPIFMLFYEWPTRALFWIWLLVPVALIFVLRSDRAVWEGGLIVILAVAGFASGALAWQQNYTHQWMHLDPDRYGLYGEMISNWVAHPEERPRIEAWIREYPHAHVILTPILIAAGMLVGLSKSAAYLFVVGLATSTTLLLVHFHLRRQLGLSRTVTAFGLVMFATHLLFLKAAGRPSTDALGLTTVVALIVALMARVRGVSWRHNAWLSLLLLLAAWARPPGLAYFVPVLMLALGIDGFREWSDRGWAIGRRIRTGFAIALPPILVLLALYVGFDWFYTQKLSMEKSIEFQAFSTGALFLRCLIPLLTILPLAWFWIPSALKKQRSLCAGVAIYGVWLVFYLAMLWLVKAPFLTRLFVPVVPAVVLLSVVGLAGISKGPRRISFFLVAGGAVASIAILHYVIGLPFLPPIKIAPFIY